jgi:hypothetical protein
MTAARTAALGGVRDVPIPDPVARDYLLLALRLDQHIPGTVDGYFGPADLKAQVDTEQLRPAARLAEDASDLRGRLTSEIDEPERREWLDLQLVAIETLALVRAGEPIGYRDQVTRCFANTPRRRSNEDLERAADALDALLPGDEPLAVRLAGEDRRWMVAPDRLQLVVEQLVDRHRARADAEFDVPAGEQLALSFVRGQPWAAYNWYEGGLRSRVDINVDRPIELPRLVGTLAHETFPGHHLEHASKEWSLIEHDGRMEASVLLINTPECLVSEGLAEAGRTFAVPSGELARLLVDLAGPAGLELAAEPAALTAAADRVASMVAPRRDLDAVRVNAALALHEDGWSRDRVVAYLVEAGRMSGEWAERRMAFIEHPMWRLYVHAYPEGEALVRRWLEAVAEPGRTARFSRLLREQLTPPALARDVGPGGASA